MFLHRWSKLSQILRMSYCSSCRRYLLPSREICHVKWGDRFPCSILALGNRVRKVWSWWYSLTRTYLWESSFWNELFNMTVEVCIGQFTHTILFWSSVLEKLAPMLLKSHFISAEAYSPSNVCTTDEIAYIWRYNG